MATGSRNSTVDSVWSNLERTLHNPWTPADATI